MTDIYVPVIGLPDPVTHIMDTLGAMWREEEALAACVDGDWVVHLQVVSVKKAQSSFVLVEEVVDG